ncbi:hypothetical protein [Streptomyces sp. NPDC058202]|uniref:hypothetical protein n=1 Tax=Streptomyces sp. NPDC058202 TaxID=3346380 RepID=UPI0036E0B1EC
MADELQYAKRLPARLQDLTGPTHGSVDLPLHATWSGRCSYDVEQPRSRMSPYRTVLTEGQRQDLVAFLNRDLLLGQRPVLRTLVAVRRVPLAVVGGAAPRRSQPYRSR